MGRKLNNELNLISELIEEKKLIYDEAKEQYYPLLINTKSVFFNIVDNSRDHLIDIVEIMFGVDTVTFDDQ